MMPMYHDNALDRICRIISERLACGRDEVRPQTTLSDLGADSLDLIEICQDIEEAFGIEVDDADEEVVARLSVEAVAAMVDLKRPARRG